jgi:hypothetical protein
MASDDNDAQGVGVLPWFELPSRKQPESIDRQEQAQLLSAVVSRCHTV